MELQQEISFQINTSKIGNIEKIVIDRIENEYYIGRSQYDSPEVDNEILILKENHDLSIGQFYEVRISGADYFDLTAVPV